MSNTAHDCERYIDPSGEKMKALVRMDKNSVEAPKLLMTSQTLLEIVSG
jgi:hypothetical protein